MKWFRIATEGATTDGRTISANWLEQMATNFDPDKYGCRVNLEHIGGVLPDSPFKAYGDVTALKIEKNDAGKIQLLATIDPTDELKALNDKRQKVYTSMEVDPDFAGTGEAYLVGLAVTDSPASLGTSMLQFSAQQQGDSPLASRKQRPENLFSVAAATEFDFSEGEPEPVDSSSPRGPSLAERVKAMFKRHRQQTDGDFTALRDDLEQTMALFVADNAALRTELDKRPTLDQHSSLQQAHDELKSRFDELYSKLDSQPRTPQRPSATGSDGTIETDC